MSWGREDMLDYIHDLEMDILNNARQEATDYLMTTAMYRDYELDDNEPDETMTHNHGEERRNGKWWWLGVLVAFIGMSSPLIALIISPPMVPLIALFYPIIFAVSWAIGKTLAGSEDG